MATTIAIDGTLTLDQSAGLQDNDFALSSSLAELSDRFEKFLLGTAIAPDPNIPGSLTLDADQLSFAALVDAAKTSSTYVTVTPEANATISDLFFSDSDGNAFNGDQVFYDHDGLAATANIALKTLSGSNVYLHSYDGGNIVLATTSATAGDGDVVAAFYLNEAGDHLTASIEMVTFMALEHPDATNPDDDINWSDLLNVSAAGSLSFNFDVLDSGKFLWAAIGSDENGLLISGLHLDTDAAGKAEQTSDFVNTSQGGQGATIGIDNQMFTPGDTAVITLVEGFEPLANDVQAHSNYLVDTTKGGNTYEGINYDGYTDVSSAKLFFSQDQGAGTFDCTISLWEAGGASGTPEEEMAYVGSEPSGAFLDDTAINVRTVTVYGASATPGVLGPVIGTWAVSPTGSQFVSGSTHGGVTVTINANSIDINGLDAFYTVEWSVVDGIVTDETFNRFRIQADTGKFDIGRLDLAQGTTTTVPVGDKLFVDDDGPVLDGDMLTKHVDEDNLRIADTDQSNGNEEFGAGGIDIDDGDGSVGEQDEVTFTQADLGTILNSGTDVPAVFALNLSVSGNVMTTSGVNVTSQGDQVVWDEDGGVIRGVVNLGTADQRVIFTLTTNDNGTPLDPTDDSFSFDLLDQLDHGTLGDLSLLTLNLTPAFTAKDADDDPVDLDGADGLATPIRVEVENDVPVLSGATASARVEEDELSTAAPGPGDPPADNSNGITDSDGAANDDEDIFDYSDLSAIVTAGADEPAKFGLNLSVSGAVKDVDGNAMYSRGEAMTWSVSSGVVQAVAGGRIVFTLTQTAGALTLDDPTDDAFTVDLRDQIDHVDGSGDDGIETLDLTPAFTARDYDGDTVDLNGPNNDLRPIQLVVENDVPAITAQILDGAVDFVLSDFASSSLNGLIGADDNNATNQTSAGVKQYTITSFSEPKNVFADLDGVLSADGTKVTYYSTSVTADQNASTAIYELTLNQTANGGAGSYTFTVLKPPPIVETSFSFADQPAGQNLFGIIAANKGNIVGTAPDATLPDGGLLFFNKGADLVDGAMTNASSTVNTSKGGGEVSIGYGANNYTADNQDCFFIFADNPNTAAVGGLGLTQTTADDADTIRFNGSIEVTSASVEIVKIVSGSEAGVTIKAWDLDDSQLNINSDALARELVTNPLTYGATDASQVDINGLRVFSIAQNGTVTLVYSAKDGNGDGDFTDAGEILVNSGNVTVVENADGSVKVTGLDTNKDYTIRYDTVTAHDMSEVQWEAGSYNIGGFNITQGQDTPDQLFDFSVQIADYDGDEDGGLADTFANFSVLVDGTGIYNDPLVG